MDIRCVRLKPYNFENKVLLDVQRIIPLPEAASYQVQIKEKVAEQRQSRREGGKYDLTITGKEFSNLPKRRLIYNVVRGAIESGVSPEDLQSLMPGRNRWLTVEGECLGSDFCDKAQNKRTSRGTSFKLRRFFNNDDELFHVNGKTYALTKMWGRTTITIIDKIKAKYPELSIDYRESASE